MVIWFIGKSAAGKTYIGRKLYDALSVNYANIVFLDGDQLRNAISKSLIKDMQYEIYNCLKIKGNSKNKSSFFIVFYTY